MIHKIFVKLKIYCIFTIKFKFMLNTKLKRLLKHAIEIVCFYQNVSHSTYEIVPYCDEDMSDSEAVTIRFFHQDDLSWDFLEPVSDYCKTKELTWYIRQEDGYYIIELNY